MSAITVDRAVLEQALRALEFVGEDMPHWAAVKRAQAITALRTALAQEEQEPVAWANSANIASSKVTRERGGQGDVHTWSETKSAYHDKPLYTAPPRREWQSLTEEEPVAYTGDVARRMREAEMTFHLGMPHAVVMQQMTRFHDLVCAEASLRAAAAFAIPPRRESQPLKKEDVAQNLRSRHDAAKLLEERRQEIAQPRREWQGLSEEELLPLLHSCDWRRMHLAVLCRAIEQALKEKNA
jgi:hypothetical protein